MDSINTSRRKFLVSSAAGFSGLVIAQSTVAKPVINLLDPGSPLVIPDNFEPCVWFTMQSSGKTNIHVFRQEIGQHIGTSLAQIVAEELELDWSQVSIDYPEMDMVQFGKTGAQNTGGSMSVLRSFEPLSRSAAVAREFLIEAGAEILGSEPSDCYAKNGFVIDDGYGEQISYGQILSQTVIQHEIQPEEMAEIRLKNKDDYTIIGQSLDALDINEKVNGKARFGIDSYAPNMVFGKLSLGPTRLGSTISMVDDSEAKEIEGYIDTISVSASGFPGITPETEVALVIATSFPVAMRAEKLIDIKWDVPSQQLVNSRDLTSEAKTIQSEQVGGQTWLEVGDMDSALGSNEVFSASYETAMIEHAALEPRSALVQKIDDVFHIYSGTHNPTRLIQGIASVLEVPPERVVYHPHLIGGSFGDKIYNDQIMAAAIACKKLDRPVKVILTREDQFNLGHPKTSSFQKLTAAIKKDTNLAYQKRVVAIGHDVVAAPQFPMAIDGAIYDDRFDKTPEASPVFGARGIMSSADHWYDLDHALIRYFKHDSINEIVPTGAVRTVGNFYTIFAIESFIDEVAHEVGVDPLDLRLSLLKGAGRNAGAEYTADGEVRLGAGQVTVGGAKRLANVLKIAAGQANYGSVTLGTNSGQGIAIAGAEGRWNPTFSACVADVSVTLGGNISVDRLTVCSDVGIAINPLNVRAQIEGSMLWGLSSALFEETILENGRLKDENFDSYKWQRNDRLPEIDIHIVENGIHPSGIGESTLALVAPAICNAIYNINGKRLRSLPIKNHLPFA